jgi:hypothetical protein
MTGGADASGFRFSVSRLRTRLRRAGRFSVPARCRSIPLDLSAEALAKEDPGDALSASGIRFSVSRLRTKLRRTGRFSVPGDPARSRSTCRIAKEDPGDALSGNGGFQFSVFSFRFPLNPGDALSASGFRFSDFAQGYVGQVGFQFPAIPLDPARCFWGWRTEN